MAKGRDRPRHQEKRKPKEKAPKISPTPPASAYQQSMSVEVIKPRRKPRSTEPGPSE
jgi:hypothetical protein